MLKKSLVAVAAVMLSGTVLAASAIKCEPPVIQVAAAEAKGTAQYSISCEGVADVALTPAVTFMGEMHAHGTPPYQVKATYAIDTRSLYDQKLNKDGRVDQSVIGYINLSTVSVAALPTQFSAKTQWDSASSTLSVEESPGRWHIYATSLEGYGAASIMSSGFAGAPVEAGRTSAKVTLGAAFSRFAGKGASAPVVAAQLGLRAGKLELLLGETRVANQSVLQGALLNLDKRPTDLTRAWALASVAKYLGLDDEVRYAEQKVAAHNPQHLESFQEGLNRITPFKFSAE